MRGSAGVDRLHLRRTTIMDDAISPREYVNDADCSGRSLATLIVAWVGAAMVASVLLRWTYMWIALAVLTLLFLFACGYAACNARRIHERALAREEEREAERERRRRELLVTVSGTSDNNYGQIVDPPADYRGYWIVADLPPSYASVVIGHGPNATPVHRNDNEESNPSGPRPSNPPPYSVAILSLAESDQTRQPIDCDAAQRCRTLQTQMADPTIPPRAAAHAPSSPKVDVDDKSDRAQQSQSSTVLSTGAHYLTSIISCTFGRGQKSGPNEERPGDDACAGSTDTRTSTTFSNC